MNDLSYFQRDILAFADLLNIRANDHVRMNLRRAQAGQRRSYVFRSAKVNNNSAIATTGVIALWRALCFDDDPYVGVVAHDEDSAREWFQTTLGIAAFASPVIKDRIVVSQDCLAVREREQPGDTIMRWRMGWVCSASGVKLCDRAAMLVMHRFDDIEADVARAVQRWNEAMLGNTVLVTYPSGKPKRP